MRGSHTRHSTLKFAVTTMIAALVASLAIAPAQAHERSNVFKQRRHIKSRAKSAAGSPYSYGGTSRGGFDCSGFTMWTYEGHGQRLPHSSSEQFKLAKRPGYKRIWKRENLKKGDLVFHKTTRARVGHAGIYIGKGKFISSTSSDGVRVNSLYDRYYWGRRWVAGVRTPSTVNH
ncbi:MAG: C40 family peptidase [Actinomycetota bacterium]